MPRSFWTMVIISLVAVTLLQWGAGTPASPVERWLHVTKVPTWWPFVLAGITGIVGGAVLNRQLGAQGGGAEAGRSGGGGRPPADAKRGRYAVPRHVRRERERERRRAERRADAEARVREAEAEAAKAAAEAEAPPAAGWLGRIGGIFSRRPQ